jgi:DNA-binding CsgD family transcriptional regulator
MWIGFPEIYLLSIENSQLYSKNDLIFSVKEVPNSSRKDIFDGASEYCLYLDVKNYKSIMLFLEKFQKFIATRKLYVVTPIPSLAILGIKPEKFPSQATFFGSDEFALITSKRFHARLEVPEFPAQISPPEIFFKTGGLTDNHVNLLLLLADGLTNAEMAKRLKLSEKGIESALSRLAIRLNAESPNTNTYNQRVLILRRYAQLLGII